LTVVFHPLAERELIESAKFDDKRAAGLGADFIRQVEHTLAKVVADPGAGKVLSGAIRRKLVQRFPFAVLYRPYTDMDRTRICHRLDALAPAPRLLEAATQTMP
jgi:hypothetical protein